MFRLLKLFVRLFKGFIEWIEDTFDTNFSHIDHRDVWHWFCGFFWVFLFLFYAAPGCEPIARYFGVIQ